MRMMTDAAQTTLALGAWLLRSRVNGPGCRFVLWLQGCSRHCPECCNPQFQSFDDGQWFSVQAIYEMIMATSGIEGVTYSGGEPFEQAEGLYQLSCLLQEAGLTLMAYSGFSYETLCRHPDAAVTGLLSQLDVLIDGPYELQQAASLLWRGSRNQHVYFLTDRYRHYAADIAHESLDIELSIAGGIISLTGTADEEAFQKILHILQPF